MQRPSRVIIVTGANKGIGYSLMKRLIKHPEPSTLVLTSRNETLGKEAMSNLIAEQPSIKENLHYHVLDVTKPDSIAAFAEWVNQTFGKYDVLVNNAGVMLKNELSSSFEPTMDEVNYVVGTNFFATKALTEKLLPFLSDDGKIINVSSELAYWSTQGRTLTELFTKSDFQEKDLEKAYQLFETAAQNKSFARDDVTNSPYKISKALINAWTHYVLPKQLKGDQQCFTMTPGWCKTDMGGAGASRSADKGAETLDYLIGLPFKFDKNLNGKFFMDKKVINF